MAKTCAEQIEPLAECKNEFGHIKEKLDMLIKLTKGNGSEDNCMMTRLTKIEESVSLLRKVAWLMVSTIIVACLTACVGALAVARFGVS